jgi:D-alanyl-lipoteichoic acid acyltransferase DltB (MBOAT superfamily)
MKVRNTFIIFIVSGFWHGANWTFIVWGALNAIYFLPLLLRNKNRVHTGEVAANRILPSLIELKGIIITFSLTVLAWVFFRAENISHALSYLSSLFIGLGDYINYYKSYRYIYNVGSPFIITFLIFLILEWYGRAQNYAIEEFGLNYKPVFRYGLYSVIIISIFWFIEEEQQFIYFQF